MNNVALIHESHTGSSVERGNNGRIIQLHFGAVTCRLVGFDLRRQLIDHRPLRIVHLLRNDLGSDLFRIALQVEPGIGQLGFVLRYFRHRLFKLSAKRIGIN